MIAAVEPGCRVERGCARRRKRQGRVDGRGRKHAFARAGLCLDRRRGIQAAKPQVAIGESVAAVPRSVGVEGYYDPTTSTFTTRDPLGEPDGTTVVANPYAYTRNDPLNGVDPLGLRAQDTDYLVPSLRYCVPKSLQGLGYTPAMVGKPGCPLRVYRQYLDWVGTASVFVSPDNGGFGVSGALFKVGNRRVGVSASSGGMPIVNAGELTVSVGGDSATFDSVAGMQRFEAILNPSKGANQWYPGDPLQVTITPGGNESPYQPQDGAALQFGKKSFFNTSDYFNQPDALSANPAWFVQFYVEYLFRKFYEVDDNGHTRRVSDIQIDVGIDVPDWKHADGLVRGLDWRVEPQWSS